VGSLQLNPGEDNLASSIISASAGFAYFGPARYNSQDPTSPTTEVVVKVLLGVGDSSPTRVAAFQTNTGETGLFAAIIDNSGTYGFFVMRTSNSVIIKRDLVTDEGGDI